jgi:hypothetical protein
LSLKRGIAIGAVVLVVSALLFPRVLPGASATRSSSAADIASFLSDARGARIDVPAGTRAERVHYWDDYSGGPRVYALSGDAPPGPDPLDPLPPTHPLYAEQKRRLESYFHGFDPKSVSYSRWSTNSGGVELLVGWRDAQYRWLLTVSPSGNGGR